jgi:hypothetical protein
MYHIRVESEKSYTWAITTAHITCMNWATNKQIKFQFHDLSKYCVTQGSWLKKSDNIHCVQYMIDAEYCPVLCLYFYVVYIMKRMPTTENGLKNVVEECFIVSPRKLNRGNFVSTNTFRITFFAFLLTFMSEWYMYISQVVLSDDELVTTQEMELWPDLIVRIRDAIKQVTNILVIPNSHYDAMKIAILQIEQMKKNKQTVSIPEDGGSARVTKRRSRRKN